MASFVALVGDLIERLSDLYWATGVLVVLGGFVLFVAEIVSHLLRRRERGPRVVNVHIEKAWIDARSVGAIGTPRPDQEERAALPPGGQ
jgi:hypothetical protein